MVRICWVAPRARALCFHKRYEKESWWKMIPCGSENEVNWGATFIDTPEYNIKKTVTMNDSCSVCTSWVEKTSVPMYYKRAHTLMYNTPLRRAIWRAANMVMSRKLVQEKSAAQVWIIRLLAQDCEDRHRWWPLQVNYDNTVHVQCAHTLAGCCSEKCAHVSSPAAALTKCVNAKSRRSNFYDTVVWLFQQ